MRPKRIEKELKNYLLCDLAAAKIQRNLAQLQAKRLFWAMLALAALAATSTSFAIGLALWITAQPMPKPLFFV